MTRQASAIHLVVLSPDRKLSLRPHPQQSAINASCGVLSTNLPLFSGRFQLPVALRADLLLPPRQHAERTQAYPWD
jgi:hypothetical protein